MKIGWDRLNFSKLFHYLIAATGNGKPCVKIISGIDVDSSLTVSGAQPNLGFIIELLPLVSRKVALLQKSEVKRQKSGDRGQKIGIEHQKPRRMKVKSPLVNKNEVKPLCEAGADEFFCGIEPSAWRVRFKDFCINQRSTGANFTKLSDLEKAIQIAHQYKARVHVAANAFFYLEEQYKMIKKIIKDVLDVAADGIIFADPGLLSIMDKNLLRNKDVIVGCDAVIFNSASVKFYKRLGATRIVLPRSMTIREIREVVQADRSMEYEVFIIHDLCFFEDGFCTYCKEQSGGIKKEGKARKKIYLFSASRLPARGYGGGCRSQFRRYKISLVRNRELKYVKKFNFWMKKHIQGCGACAIYGLKHIDVTSLKVLDRNLPTEEKIKATEFIRKSSDLLGDNNISKADYIDKCKDLFKKTFKVKCNRYDCYYPDANTRESNANKR